MQANGSGQERESELSLLAGTQNGETSSGMSHSNGLLTSSNNNGVICHSDSASDNSTEDGTSGRKKKNRLSESEEDVIRLIGQHLHDLGLK